MLVGSSSSASLYGPDPDNKTSVLQSTSWNIAAVNNNPFEYWITNQDPAYNALIKGAQKFIESPLIDFPIRSIFTDQMFSELQDEMRSQKIPGTNELRSFWIDDYGNRMAVDQFLKDRMME